MDARLQVTAPHEWMALAGLAIALLALLAWSVFGSVERSVTAPAVLAQSGERHELVALASGQVVEVLAAVGDVVQRGQPIARVHVLEGQREAQLARELVGALEAETSGADSAAATVQQALLDAARAELRRIERSAAQSIVASRAGTIVSLDLALGKPVRLGDTVARLRDGTAGAWQALAFVPARDAEELAVGQAAEVVFSWPEEPGRAFEASVLEVSGRPMKTPEWLLDLGFSTAAPAYLLRLAVPGMAGVANGTPDVEGASGTARVFLGKRSLAALLLARGSPPRGAEGV